MLRRTNSWLIETQSLTAGEEYGRRYQLLQRFERAEPLRVTASKYTQMLRDAHEYYTWVRCLLECLISNKGASNSTRVAAGCAG